MAKKNTKTYTVSQITALIKGVLENNLPGRFTVSGEISQWKQSSKGHCYFSLKEEQKGSIVVLPCVMWQSGIGKLKFSPEGGMAVFATGNIDVYPPQGRYQFLVGRMEPAGVGALQIAFEQMVKKLEGEGLFREEYKKSLPPYPMRIGIVTSESGAVVHDITESIRGRWPCAKLFLYPVPVQGKGAAEKIAEAIRDMNHRNKELQIDLMIAGRGGGSLEDLWAFNEEVLARAIFESKIPVVSAVGHEVDVTVADLAADVRASTPTKAGVVSVPDAEEIEGKLRYLTKSLSDRTGWKLKLCEQQIDELGFSLSDTMKDSFARVRQSLSDYYEKVLRIEPHRLLGKRNIEINDLTNRAGTAMKAALNRRQLQLTAAENRLLPLKPYQLLGKRNIEINDLTNRAGTAMKAALNRRQLQLTAAENRLLPLNPKSVLNRGYSITTDKQTGKVIKKAEDVRVGQGLLTELANENFIESKVVKK